mgnify:CR=1
MLIFDSVSCLTKTTITLSPLLEIRLKNLLPKSKGRIVIYAKQEKLNV